MKVTILGAGLIGLTSAYMLMKDGHDVTVIDRHDGAGKESSFANGAQLSYAHAEPWSSPASFKKAIKWLGKKDAPLLIKPSLDFKMWSWLFRFMLECTDKAVIKNTERILALSLYSSKILHEIESDFNFDFNHTKGGKLFLFRNEKDFESYLKQARLQEGFGSKYEILTVPEAIEHEPGIADISGEIYKCVRNPFDETADAHKYCVGLASQLQETGVEIRYNESVEDFIKEGDRIKSVKTDIGEYQSDLFVLCLGAYSPVLARKLGIKLPVYPLKGYSITVEIEDELKAPKESITDSSEKLVYSRIGNKMRVAGSAEFTGYNHDITDYRIEMLRSATKRNFGKAGDLDKIEKWSCLRPFAPDGSPIMGFSKKVDNLVFNTGHGTLGWTQTFASAKIISDIIAGKDPNINMDWYSLERF